MDFNLYGKLFKENTEFFTVDEKKFRENINASAAKAKSASSVLFGGEILESEVVVAKVEKKEGCKCEEGKCVCEKAVEEGKNVIPANDEKVNDALVEDLTAPGSTSVGNKEKILGDFSDEATAKQAMASKPGAYLVTTKNEKNEPVFRVVVKEGVENIIEGTDLVEAKVGDEVIYNGNGAKGYQGKKATIMNIVNDMAIIKFEDGAIYKGAYLAKLTPVAAEAPVDAVKTDVQAKRADMIDKPTPKLDDKGEDEVFDLQKQFSLPSNTRESKINEDQYYDIVRFRQNGNKRVVQRHVTLEQAKEHCNDPKTKGKDWFDGYVKESKEDATLDVIKPKEEKELINAKESEKAIDKSSEVVNAPKEAEEIKANEDKAKEAVKLAKGDKDNDIEALKSTKAKGVDENKKEKK